jgi:hypothetical protein
MEAQRKRNIQSGEGYTHLFPEANNANDTIRKNASVYDTVTFIPKVVHSTLHHTKKVAELLKAPTVKETCNNIWQFVYNHIAYKKDKDGYEQIRSPARAWADRFSGVDCDCYSVFISSILTNLSIPHTLRITKYQRDYFQHIYPIVPTKNGCITIDCVTDQFNYEVPYSEKKDYPMDLQYLNGLDNVPALYADPNDAHYVGATDGMEELGKLISKRFGTSASKTFKTPPKKTPRITGKQRRQEKRAKADAEGKPRGFKTFINKFNKFNPITLALRNGVLASMKLNIKNVAARLRWSYLTQEQATKKGIALARFQQLLNTRKKLDSIFYKAGGKPENLRKAILKGKGNKDKAVQGLDGFEGNDYAVLSMDEYTPLPQLLGSVIYHSENIEGFDGMDGIEEMVGLGELGEPITLASIAAASKVISAIAAKLKNIGNIFSKKNEEGSEDFDETKNEKAEKEPLPQPSKQAPELPEATQPPAAYKDVDELPPSNNQLPYNHRTDRPAYNPSPSNRTATPRNYDAASEEQMPAVVEKAAPPAITKDADKTDDTKVDDKDDKDKGFWDKNKKWLKPTIIGVGGLGLLAIGASMLKSSKQKSNSSNAKAKPMNGVAKHKKHHRKSKGSKVKNSHQHHHHKKEVALF